MPHVTFIHGIGNKVEAKSLEQSWVDALRDGGGPDLPAEDVSTSLCYWADVLYESPLPDTPAVTEAGEEADILAVEVVDEPWFRELPEAEQREVLELAAEVGAVSWLDDQEAASANRAPEEPDEDGVDFERVPLPGPIKRQLMAAFLRDVHHYLWNVEFSPGPGRSFAVRTEVRRRALDALAAAAETSRPHLVVGHSLGSVVAYDVLQNVANAPSTTLFGIGESTRQETFGKPALFRIGGVNGAADPWRATTHPSSGFSLSQCPEGSDLTYRAVCVLDTTEYAKRRRPPTFRTAP